MTNMIIANINYSYKILGGLMFLCLIKIYKKNITH